MENRKALGEPAVSLTYYGPVGTIFASTNLTRRCRNVPKQIENTHNGTSRRRFLGVLGIGIAGAALVAGMMPFGRRNQTAEAASEFPGPGSMFHPAQDPRTDPRR